MKFSDVSRIRGSGQISTSLYSELFASMLPLMGWSAPMLDLYLLHASDVHQHSTFNRSRAETLLVCSGALTSEVGLLQNFRAYK